jgi:hypothetical protein
MKTFCETIAGHSLNLLIGIGCFLISIAIAVPNVSAGNQNELPMENAAPIQEPSSDVFGTGAHRDINYCIGEVGFGPLKLLSQSPFQSLRLGMTPLAPSTISRDEWEIFLSGTLANIWANTEDEYFLDYETINTQASLAYGITNTLKIEIAYEERRIFGGFFDSFITEFHDAFGLDQDGRDEMPYGDVNIAIWDDEGHLMAARDDGGIVSRGLKMTFQHNVSCGSKLLPAFSYSLQIRQELEEAGPLDRDKAMDFGVSLAASKRLSDVYLYLTGGYFIYGADKAGEIKLRKNQKSGLLAVEWRYETNRSLLVQMLVSEGQAIDLGSFSDYSYEITLGWKWEMIRSYVVELGIIENVIIYDNSPDLGVHLGMSHRF